MPSTLVYATTATGTVGTWTNPSNATGVTNSAYATWVDATRRGTATLRAGGFGTFSIIPSDAIINSVTVIIRGFVSSNANVPTITSNDNISGTDTGLGAVTLTPSTSTSNTWTYTDPNVTLAQLQSGNFQVDAAFTRANNTTSSTVSIDTFSVTVNYTSPAPIDYLSEDFSVASLPQWPTINATATVANGVLTTSAGGNIVSSRAYTVTDGASVIIQVTDHTPAGSEPGGHVFGFFTNDGNGPSFRYSTTDGWFTSRTFSGGSSQGSGFTPPATPFWLRLGIDSVNGHSYSYSSDATNWTVIQTFTETVMPIVGKTARYQIGGIQGSQSFDNLNFPPVSLTFVENFSSNSWKNWATDATVGYAANAFTAANGVGVMQTGSPGGNSFNRALIPGTPSTTTDQGVLLSFTFSSSATSGESLNISLRGNGLWSNADPNTGYRWLITGGAGSSASVARYVNGTPTADSNNVGTGSMATRANGSKYWLRAETIGTTAQIRIWADGSAEPTTWATAATGTGSSITAGKLQIGSFVAATTTISIDDIFYYVAGGSNAFSGSVAFAGAGSLAAVGPVSITEDFSSGTWGAWTTSSINGSGTATVSGGKGVLNNVATTNNTVRAVLTGSPTTTTDQGVTWEMAFATPLSQTFRMSLRSDKTWASSSENNAYVFAVEPFTSSSSLSTFYKVVGGTQTQLGQWTVSPFPASGTTISYRFEVIGTTLQYRSWTTGTAEPATWAHTATDTSIASGGLQMSALSSTAQTTTLDNISYYSGTAPAVTGYSGSVTLAGSGSLTNPGVPALTQSLPLSGFGSLTVPATPKPTQSVTLTGSGSLAVPAVPAPAQAVPLAGSGSLSASGTATFANVIASITTQLYDGNTPLGSPISHALSTDPANVYAPFDLTVDVTGVSLATLRAGNLNLRHVVTRGSTTTTSIAYVDSAQITATYLTSQPALVFTGTVTLSGLGALTLSGAPQVAAIVTLAGAGSLVTTGAPAPTVTATLTGSGSLTATAVTLQTAQTAAFAGSGSLIFVTSLQTAQTAPLSGSGALTFATALTATGAATLSGSGTLTTAVTPKPTQSVALAGAGTLTLAGAAQATQTVALTGAGVLTLTLVPKPTQVVPLAGSGSLTTVGVSVVTQTVPFTGSGTLTLAGVPAPVVAVSLTGAGSLTLLVTQVTAAQTATLTGSGSLTTVTSLTTTGSAAITGSGALTLTGLAAVSQTALLTGDGSLSAAGVAVSTQLVVLAGDGSLAVAGSPTAAQSAVLSGAGSLTTVASPGAAGAVTRSGAGTLATTVTFTVTRTVTLTGSGSLTSTRTVTVAGSVSLTGSGSLDLRDIINLYWNPTFATGISGGYIANYWSSNRSWDSTQSYDGAGGSHKQVFNNTDLTSHGVGAYYASTVASPTGTNWLAHPVLSAGQPFSGSMRIKGPVGRQIYVSGRGYTSAASPLFISGTETAGQVLYTMTGGWDYVKVEGVTYAQDQITMLQWRTINGWLDTDVFNVDQVIFVYNRATVPDYFDGNSNGAYWTGTPNASPSVRYGVLPAIQQTAGLTGDGTLTISPVAGASAAAALDGSGSLSSTVSITAQDVATLGGAGTLSFTASAAAQGAVNLTGTGALTASTTVTASGVGVLAGSGSLTSTQTVVLSGSRTLTGSGTLSATGTALTTVAVNLTGAGTLAATAPAITVARAVALSGTGTLTIAASVVGANVVSVSGVGVLVTTGSAPIIKPAVPLSGSGALTFTVIAKFTASTALSGTGTLVINASPAFTPTTALTGSGQLTTTRVPAIAVAVALAGSGTLSTTVIATAQGSVNFTGSGQLALSAVSIAYAVSTNFTGSGSLLITAAGAGSVTVNLAGTGALTATARPTTAGAVILTGSGVLEFILIPRYTVQVDFAASGSLTTSRIVNVTRAVTLSGSGVLSIPTRIIAVSTTATLSGTGVLVPSVSVLLTGTASLTGTGQLAFVTRPSITVTLSLNGVGELQAQIEFVTADVTVTLTGDGALLLGLLPAFITTVDLASDGELSFAAALTALAVMYLQGAGYLATEPEEVVGFFSDDFNTDGSLENFVTTTGQPPLIENQHVVGSATPTVSRWITSAGTTTGQYAEEQYLGGAETGVAVALPGFNSEQPLADVAPFYALVSPAPGEPLQLVVKDQNTTTYTVLSVADVGAQPGDVLRLEYSNGLLTGSLNGSSVLTYAPLLPISGNRYVGFVSFSGANDGTPILDNWAGGNTISTVDIFEGWGVPV